MLLNRTCHLVENVDGRSIKIPSLVFCLVLPLRQFIETGKNQRNHISNLIHNKTEFAGFLPESEEHGIPEPLVVNFNQVWTFNLIDCPEANRKVAQLSSPFVEHMIQRFSRWFYTIGYDDSPFRSEKYLSSIITSLAQSRT